MLALAYVALMVLFGDTIARPFFSYVSRLHRLATAFLVGLLLSTWLSYLAAFAFRNGDKPLIAGDALAAWVMAIVIAVRLVPAWWRRRAARRTVATEPMAGADSEATPDPGAARSERWDWVVIGGIALFITWMMVSTYNVSGGRLNIAVDLWSDFGPTTAIAQSFALGHNFPTEYPHFAGPPILYHFLFYFQVGNLTFLGLDPATANNVLSIGALTSMLALVMALGRRLFGSAAVGRIAAILFFFHGALSVVPYLASFASPADALAALGKLEHYLSSGLPYRGEEWGIWTQNTFLNQRHLSTAIGIVLVALLFVIDRVQARRQVVAASMSPPAAEDLAAGGWASTSRSAAAMDLAVAARDRLIHLGGHIRAGLRDPFLPGFAVTGLLLGLLPLFNGPMYIASAALFGMVFLLFPNRVQMLVLAIAAAIPALPQVLFLRPDSSPATQAFPMLHWGYTVDPPTLLNVAVYIAFIFGLKLLLALVGLIGADSIQRRLFLALASLVVLAFTIQFSVEVFANHKFLNLWLILVNLFAAHGLVWLWGRLRGGTSPAATGGRLLGRLVAVSLVAVIAVGGLVDLLPIGRERSLTFPLAGDRLFDWVANETRPRDVFLTDLYVAHPILLAGRAIYLGWPYYAWGAGYPEAEREVIYRQMLSDEDPATVLRLLQEQGIAYVAIDDGLRQGSTVDHLNEDVYRNGFQVAFDDPEGTYGHITIYRVPEPSTPIGSPTPGGSPGPGGSPPPSGPPPSVAPTAQPPANMFLAGTDAAAGRFVRPRGIAVEPDGTVLVADSGNHLVERYAADGTYLGAIGGAGSEDGQFNEPNGVAVDSRGQLYVADTLNHRLQEFDERDQFVRAWRGPDIQFYGPRDLATSATDDLYILDQGHARVVVVASGGAVTTFGTFGSGPGQLNDPTGLAVAAGTVVVADTPNSRIQVFDTSGRFVRSLSVPEWNQPFLFADVVLSPDGRVVYASSPNTNEIFVYTIDGSRTATLRPPAPDALDGPAAMALTPEGDLLVVDYGAGRVTRVTP